MACLSISEDAGPLVVCANPIFLLSPPQWSEGAEIVFEVLEPDAQHLRTLLGTVQEYALDGKPFRGRLASLEPCESSHQGLRLLRNQAPLRGVLTIVSRAQPNTAQH